MQGAPFVIKTDHFSFKFLLEQRITHAVQHKGMCKLMGLDYTIQYKRGVDNTAADALSRRIPLETEQAETMAVTELIPKWIEELKASYEGDGWVKEALTKVEVQPTDGKISIHKGVIRYKGRIYVGNAQGWRCRVMQWMHDSSIGSHSGILGTL